MNGSKTEVLIGNRIEGGLKIVNVSESDGAVVIGQLNRRCSLGSYWTLA